MKIRRGIVRHAPHAAGYKGPISAAVVPLSGRWLAHVAVACTVCASVATVLLGLPTGAISTLALCTPSPATDSQLTRLTVATHTSHTHPFNGSFSGITQVSRYQKGKPIWILLKQEIVSGSDISWAICNSARRSRQITTPAPHHSVFYRPDALPAAQPTASKH